MPVTNKIVLGTVQFGMDYGINNNSGKPSAKTVNSILDLAIKNNIQLLDTAEAYGNSHEVIGNYHLHSKNKFGVITKFSSKRSDLPSDLKERVYQNLKTLNTTFLYAYMFHSFQDFKSYYPNYKDSIAELKNNGVIKKWGVSVYTNEEVEELLAYGVDLIQLPFNLLDNNNKRSKAIEHARQRGIEIHTRSAFLQGLFFKDHGKLLGKLKQLEPYIVKINEIASGHKLDVSDLSLGYVLRQQSIDHVLIGVDSVEQLEKNLQSFQKTISDRVLTEIDSINVDCSFLLNPSNWNN